MIRFVTLETRWGYYNITIATRHHLMAPPGWFPGGAKVFRLRLSIGYNVHAREFSRKPRLPIASQPTCGIDVGSIEFIHQRIIKQRDEGAAVLLVSAELDEIMALSDRIAVMYKGQIIDTVPASIATREQLGLLMAGVKPT